MITATGPNIVESISLGSLGASVCREQWVSGRRMNVNQGSNVSECIAGPGRNGVGSPRTQASCELA